MYFHPRIRLLTAVGLFLVLTVGILIVRRGYSFTVLPPSVELAAAPRSIGEWSGELSEMSEGEIQTLGADESIGLRYTNSFGQVGFVHMATWADPIEIAETCPHHPNVCYAGNGWFPVETRRADWSLSDEQSVPVEISLMGRGQERIVVAFTYQMGEQRFCTDAAARLAQAKLWGTDEWPAVSKFMAQVNGREIDAALPMIKELLLANVQWYSQQSSSSQSGLAKVDGILFPHSIPVAFNGLAVQ